MEEVEHPRLAMIITEKYNPLYRMGVVPLLRDYANGMTFRKITEVHGVCSATARQIVVESGAPVRSNDGTIYENRRSEIIESAVSEYRNGAGVRSIQLKYGIGIRTFIKYLEARGIPVRCVQLQRFPHLNEANRAAVADDFRSGMCMSEIAKKRGLKTSSVKTMLRHSGIRRRSKSETSAITSFSRLGTKNIPGFIISQWKGSARTRGREWNLTPEYLQALFDEQQGRCYYTGIPMVVKRRRVEESAVRVNPLRMSLDRIDSSKGYVIGNVVLCSAFANYAKTDMPSEEFISLLRKAGQYQLSLESQTSRHGSARTN